MAGLQRSGRGLAPGVDQFADFDCGDFRTLFQPGTDGCTVFFAGIATAVAADEAEGQPAAVHQLAGFDHFREKVGDQYFGDGVAELFLEGDLDVEAEFLEFSDVEFLALAKVAVLGHG